MEMQASRTLGVSQQQAWEALNDPEVLKLCIPGCDKVEPTGENQYAVGMALKIGPVSAKFAGKITLSEIQPPHSYTIAFDGSGGVAGFGKGSAQVRLEPLDAGAQGQERCELHYQVTATVGGKIAQLGQRLIDGAAKTMAEDFFKRFDNEMQRRYPQPAEDEVLPGAAGAASGAGGEGGAAAHIPVAGTDGAPLRTVDGGGVSPSSGIPVWVWVVGAAVLVAVAWWVN